MAEWACSIRWSCRRRSPARSAGPRSNPRRRKLWATPSIPSASATWPRPTAERNLLAVDRADLLYYLSAHQRECRRVRRLLRQALAVVQSYADYTASEDKEAFLAEPFGFLTRSDLKEHLAAAAPLKSIVDEYQRRLGRTDEDDGWP